MKSPNPTLHDDVHDSHSGIPLVVVAEEVDADSPISDLVEEALMSIRQHLDMDVAFVGAFRDGHRVFEYVSSRHLDSQVRVGGSNPLEDSYCQRVVDGRLPPLIRDATRLTEALKLPVTTALPVGAHLSVPIRFRDGTLYGTLCCFSHQADQSLSKRDLGMMTHLATFLGLQLERQTRAQRRQDRMRSRISEVLGTGAFDPVFQPILNLPTGDLWGFEALTRFRADCNRSPDQWFADATGVGLGVALELATARKALAVAREFPNTTRVSLNVSPETILDARLHGVLADWPVDRIVLEVTEHVSVGDYDRIARSLAAFRARGLRLAVDDAGAGYASFRHILSLQPDIIKLDMSLVRGIDTDSGRRALAAALIGFAAETGARIVAEGVETHAELATLRELGVCAAQGYLLGRPVPLVEALLIQESGVSRLRDAIH